MMALLLYIGATSIAGFGTGLVLGERRETWKETRRNVREEMQYEQASV